jgi:hypothetical protein
MLGFCFSALTKELKIYVEKKVSEYMYSFSFAFLTNYHKHFVLKTTKYIIYQF